MMLSLTREQQKNRPIEEKESNRWLVTMGNADNGIPAAIKVIHVCDPEGDNYELFDKAIQSGRYFLIRIAKNRMTVENGQIWDKIKKTHSKGRVKVLSDQRSASPGFETQFERTGNSLTNTLCPL